MSFKKDIFGNETKKQMNGDYRPIKKKNQSQIDIPCLSLKKYFILLSMLRSLVLDLRSRYHQLPMKKRYRYKIAFQIINGFKKYRLYKKKFLPFRFKNIYLINSKR